MGLVPAFLGGAFVKANRFRNTNAEARKGFAKGAQGELRQVIEASRRACRFGDCKCSCLLNRVGCGPEAAAKRPAYSRGRAVVAAG